MSDRHEVSTTVAPESRACLDADTAAYFERLSPRVRKEEARLEVALGRGLDEVDFDE